MKLKIIKKAAPKSVYLHLGDCLSVLRNMPDNSVDSIVTDPPYGLKFMSKKWDYDVPEVAVWAECLRVLKPGGYLLSFAGTRTQHRMAVRIEDAGFEIRDMIAWVYGSGFPKSLDVSKAIDGRAGAVRPVVGKLTAPASPKKGTFNCSFDSEKAVRTAPATEAAKQWEGWGTALKPALEPITMARKPLIGTVAENVLTHGTGGINISGSRVKTHVISNAGAGNKAGGNSLNMSAVGMPEFEGKEAIGRWPANLIHDGSEEVTECFPNTHSEGGKPRNVSGAPGMFGVKGGVPKALYSGSGSASRFFYCAKTSKTDRNEGLDAFPEKAATELLNRKEGSAGIDNPRAGAGRGGAKNSHPTVKPTELMRYLCRLVTPPGGIVLDPFMGSGSTGKAARMEGFRFIGIEREKEYLDIATARIGD